MEESSPPLAGDIEEPPCVEQQSPALEQSDIDRLLAGLSKANEENSEVQTTQEPSKETPEEESDKESFNFYQ